MLNFSKIREISFKKNIPLYPFLFVVYPFLYLYSRNLYLFSFSDVLPLLSITLGITILLLISLKFILRSYNKAGIMLSVFLIFFFSWGQFFDVFSKAVKDISLSMKIFLYSLFLLTPVIVGSIIFIFIIRTKSELNGFKRFFKFTALFLTIIALFNIGVQTIKSNPGSLTAEVKTAITEEKGQTAFNMPERLPDIYHIVLDGYARADILKEIYNYDNKEFLSWLTSKGFYIAEKSNTNYVQSCLSVSSFLNFEYIKSNLPKNSSDRSFLAKIFENNKAAIFLKQNGYKFINFPIGYFCINDSPIADANIDTGSVLSSDLFKNVFLYTTALRSFLSLQKDVDERRRRILNIFENINEISESKSKEPVYVYAHVVAPHPPFIFGSGGEKIIEGRFCIDADGDTWVGRCGSREDYIQGYRNQLIFVNSLVSNTIENILANSEIPPIIILQSDHGPGAILKWENPEETYMPERIGVLNAYYLPGAGRELLYDSITPVNTYRIIFNYYFGTNYELLEDRSYFSKWSRPYDFIDVTDRITKD